MNFQDMINEVVVDTQMRIVDNGYTFQGVPADANTIAWTYALAKHSDALAAGTLRSIWPIQTPASMTSGE